MRISYGRPTAPTFSVNGPGIAVPVNAAFTTGAGTLVAGTYYYRVAATNTNGETLASTETSLTTVSTGGINVNWGAVTGATGYNIYGRAQGGELFMQSVGAVTTWLDNGSVTPSGALPGGQVMVTATANHFSGRPALPTRYQWPRSHAAQNINTTLTITVALNTTLFAGCAAFLMPNIATAIPAGVKITVAGKLAGSPVALLGNSQALRTALLPNGAAACWWVFPAINIDTLVITIFNDLNSATWASAIQLIDTSEIWVGRCADFDVDGAVQVDYEGGLLQRQSHNNQAWPLAVQPYRKITANLTPMPENVAIGVNAAQDDYETVRNALSTAAACVIIPYYMNDGFGALVNGAPPVSITTATINQQRLTRSACLGVIDQPITTKCSNDRYFTSPIVFGESPP